MRRFLLLSVSSLTPLTFVGAAAAQISYQYDELGRLKNIDDSRAGYRQIQNLDANGNRTNLSVALASGVSFSIGDITLSEGSSFVFAITKSGDDFKAHDISYATANGAAIAGSDYTATSGNVSFSAIETVKTVTVFTTQDAVVEPNETFFVNLSSATNGASISDGQALGTINNDDASAPPVANDDFASTDAFTEYQFNPLLNDSGLPVTLTINAPTPGTSYASWSASEGLLSIGAYGTGQFTINYTITNSAGSDQGRIILEVYAPNGFCEVQPGSGFWVEC